MRELIYDVQWQGIRVSTLREFEASGGWTTTAGVADNKHKLMKYIEEAYVPLDDGFRHNAGNRTAARLYRVINLLNATRMGYSGMQLRGSYIDQDVERFRNELQKFCADTFTLQFGWDYGDSLVAAANEWDWEIVERDLWEMFKNDRQTFDRVEENLLRRNSTARKRGLQVEVTRSALQKFLQLMEVVNS